MCRDMLVQREEGKIYVVCGYCSKRINITKLLRDEIDKAPNYNGGV